MKRETIFGITYSHVHLPEGDDLYVTAYGLPFLECLMPENFWLDQAWFRDHARPLSGLVSGSGATSNIYQVRTKPVHGHQKEIVLKWNRMGQDIPGAEHDDELLMAEFNSPFEEFALVIEMRNTRHESHGVILTHKPLAIYVPGARLEPWQTARKDHRMEAKLRTHTSVELDLFRSYAVVYEWIKGLDAAEACRLGALTEREAVDLTLAVEANMERKGFRVLDRKPQHVIVRVKPDGKVLRDKAGQIPHAVVDFELLARTPARESVVKRARRHAYLQRQAHRFDLPPLTQPPDPLRAVTILGVDYIYGPAESTGGELWVVGRDPSLFDYFLPERWERAPRERLSHNDEIHRTITKDSIQLVWKQSRVGQRPDMDPFLDEERKILELGYNSPFEEVALAIHLAAAGIPTTYPRAIYLMGQASPPPPHLRDDRRFATHRDLLLPDGRPVLRPDRAYIVIWGYWNKPDEMLAAEDREHYRSLSALQAVREGILSREAYLALMLQMRHRLAVVGVTDLNLRGNHILVVLDAEGQLVRDAHGIPDARICNFELLQQTGA